jgi:hypothetical protein
LIIPHTEISNEEEIIEQLDGTSFMMLLVYDDVASTCPSIPSQSSRVRRATDRTRRSIQLLQICQAAGQKLSNILVDGVCEKWNVVFDLAFAMARIVVVMMVVRLLSPPCTEISCEIHSCCE